MCALVQPCEGRQVPGVSTQAGPSPPTHPLECVLAHPWPRPCSCDPNCETQKWHDAATGEPRIGIFATRDIQPGEELTYDYFFQHYGVSAVDTADFICMCGAPNCR